MRPVVTLVSRRPAWACAFVMATSRAETAELLAVRRERLDVRRTANTRCLAQNWATTFAQLNPLFVG